MSVKTEITQEHIDAVETARGKAKMHYDSMAEPNVKEHWRIAEKLLAESVQFMEEHLALGKT